MSELLARIDDRLNPVLVKEVRQALRGKQFRSAFIFTLVVSVIVAVSIVLGTAEQAEWTPIGPPFFMGVFACLTLAVIGFVPMAAFQSMGSEWDENTFDMLALSHLRPRHIVLGKLLAAGVQALLYFSIFGFFSVFTFLLGGVDLNLVLVGIPLLAFISLALSSLAVALSSLSQKRMVRVLLMVLLSAALVLSLSGGGCFSSFGTSCTDDDECTMESCDSESGCTTTPLECNDEDACDPVPTQTQAYSSTSASYQRPGAIGRHAAL